MSETTAAEPDRPRSAPAGDEATAALTAVLMELERHVRQGGWDQPPRLFALVSTRELMAAEPALAEALGLRTGDDDSLTAVEQEDFSGTGDLLDDLAQVSWPDTVYGCAVSLERTFLPVKHEGEIPEHPEEAAAYVAAHPSREDIRVVVGVDRAGRRSGVARLVSRPEDLLAGTDLVPGLAAALAHTLS